MAESVVHFCLDAEAGKVFFAGIFGAGVDWAAAFLAKDVPAPVALADEILVEDVSAAVSLAAGIFFTAFFPAGGDFDTLEDILGSVSILQLYQDSSHQTEIKLVFSFSIGPASPCSL